MLVKSWRLFRDCRRLPFDGRKAKEGMDMTATAFAANEGMMYDGARDRMSFDVIVHRIG